LLHIKFPLQHLHGPKLYIEKNWQEILGEFGLKCGVDWLKIKPGKLVSDSRRVKCYKIHLCNRTVVYFKTYSFHNKHRQYFLRPSKCAEEVNSYQTLKKIGIPTVTPIAFGEDRIYGMLRSCCIVTLGIEKTESLANFASITWPCLDSSEKQSAFDQIFKETIRYTQIAHHSCFFHYDLKWRNILIKKENKSYKTIWIDAPRGKYMKIRASRGRMVDLSSLSRLALSYLSRIQRYRFLKGYLGQKCSKKKIRVLWNRVERHLARRPPQLIK